MPIGHDSLNLCRLAPHLCRQTSERLFDLCCGSGIQGLLAIANELADKVLAADISPRALRFTYFNAQLNGERYASRISTCLTDVYDGVPHEWLPFDAILANPPFVAVPRILREQHAASGASVHAEWALYADGGADGADCLRAIIAGARDATLLHPGGRLAVVTEFPNIRQAAIWLLDSTPPRSHATSATPAGISCAVCFNPRHVRDAKTYAAERSEERGWPWTNAKEWETGLSANGVEHISSGLLLAVTHHTAKTSGISVPLDGGIGSENSALLETAEAGVRAASDALLRDVE